MEKKTICFVTFFAGLSVENSCRKGGEGEGVINWKDIQAVNKTWEKCNRKFKTLRFMKKGG